MLYWLLYQKLYPFFHPFRIFRYLTFRTAFASGTALLIALFIGPYVIQKLREFQIGQYIREDGPQSHQKKSGTPTMGGVLIAIAILLAHRALVRPRQSVRLDHRLLHGRPSAPSVLPTTTSRWSGAATSGLTARAKLGWQALAAAVGGAGPGGLAAVPDVLHATERAVHQVLAARTCCGTRPCPSLMPNS